MFLASPCSSDHFKINLHRLSMRTELFPVKWPLGFSKWLPRGEYRSSSQVASSISCNFLNSCVSISAGILLLNLSSKKKSRNHLSRKLRINCVLNECIIVSYLITVFANLISTLSSSLSSTRSSVMPLKCCHTYLRAVLIWELTFLQLVDFGRQRSNSCT